MKKFQSLITATVTVVTLIGMLGLAALLSFLCWYGAITMWGVIFG